MTDTQKQVAIIGGSSTGRIQNAQDQYVTAFNGALHDYNFEPITTDALVIDIAIDHFSITYGPHAIELNQFDAIIIRGKVKHDTRLLYTLSRYAAINRIPVANDFSGYLDVSKLTQTVGFFEAKVPFIRTIFSLDKQLLIDAYQHRVGFPGIFKANYGAHGENNYLIRDASAATVIFDDQSDYIAQPFVVNDGDFRVLVQGAAEPLQIYRQAQGDSHLNNTSQGAEATLVKVLPEAILHDAQRIGVYFGMHIAGVDVMHDKTNDSYVFLEVNSHPQILTGAFTDEKIAQVGEYLDAIFTKNNIA
jgi:glutathione synthase/RimK-type ligase-like ATP-grasp enzyme